LPVILAASALLVIFACTVYGVWCFLELWKNAEMAYRATWLASGAVEEFVRQRRKWPNSWNDLETLPSTAGARIDREGGWKEVRAYVVINFNLTLTDVAKQRVATFDAIAPIGPVVSNYRTFFTPLLETAREVVTAEQSAELPESDLGPERNAPALKAGHDPDRGP
jgi:hypothetical protein